MPLPYVARGLRHVVRGDEAAEEDRVPAGALRGLDELHRVHRVVAEQHGLDAGVLQRRDLAVEAGLDRPVERHGRDGCAPLAFGGALEPSPVQDGPATLSQQRDADLLHLELTLAA